MYDSPICNRIVWALLCCLALPLIARGDGCVIDRLGRYVPEHEQLGFIEWQDGYQRLYVATRTAPTDHPSLWVVPVRASPDRVQAEPVETAPQVVYSQPLVERAKERLEEALFLTAVLDSGLFPCGVLPFVPVGCGAESEKGNVREYQRVEKHGMVVTVVTAKSTEGLDRYLTANGVNSTAANLTALAPYLERPDEYALVCGWLAQGGQKLTARAVRVDFPTPIIFYPLQPTRVYESKVRTVVYVRGLVRPTADCVVPGVQCHYLRGAVKENWGYSFAPPQRRTEGYQQRPPPDATLELLTRVELTSAPSSWNNDLVLGRGAPAAIEVARLIDRYGLPLLWGATTVLGILLSGFLPWAVLAGEKRRWTDWLWAAAVGAATGLSVWVSILVFRAWKSWRFPGQTHGQGVGVLGWVILGMGATGVILVALAPLGARLNEFFLDAGLFAGAIGLLLLVLCFPLGLIYLLARVGQLPRAAWFVLFMLAHSGLACLLFIVLREWLSAYG